MELRRVGGAAVYVVMIGHVERVRVEVVGGWMLVAGARNVRKGIVGVELRLVGHVGLISRRGAKVGSEWIGGEAVRAQRRVVDGSTEPCALLRIRRVIGRVHLRDSRECGGGRRRRKSCSSSRGARRRGSRRQGGRWRRNELCGAIRCDVVEGAGSFVGRSEVGIGLGADGTGRGGKRRTSE